MMRIEDVRRLFRYTLFPSTSLRGLCTRVSKAYNINRTHDSYHRANPKAIERLDTLRFKTSTNGQNEIVPRHSIEYNIPEVPGTVLLQGGRKNIYFVGERIKKSYNNGGLRNHLVSHIHKLFEKKIEKNLSSFLLS